MLYLCKFFLVLFLTSIFSLHADTVLYKNGKELKNVRTRIKKGLIQISFENGKTETVIKKDIQSVKFTVTLWKPVQKEIGKTSNISENQTSEQEKENERLSEEAQDGNEWEERAEKDKIDPLGNAGLSLLPGYSGLYRTQNYKGAFSFSVIELGLLASIHRTSQELKNLQEENNRIKVLPVIIPRSNDNLFSYYSKEYLAVFNRVLIEPEYRARRSDLESVQNAQVASLAFVLFLNAFSSYYTASEWNEGTYKGESAPRKPTSPASRVWRSAVFPGWGQYYSGDKGKGLSLISLSGASLLLSIFYFSQESKYDELRRDKSQAIIQAGIISEYYPTLQKMQDQRNVMNTNAPGSSAYQNAYTILSNLELYYASGGIFSILNYNKNQKSIQRFEESKEAKSKAITAFAFIWIYGVVDAYFFSGRNPDSDKQGKLSFAPTFSASVVNHLEKNRLEQNIGFTIQYHW